MDTIKKLAALEPAKKGLTLFEEFKSFAFKGNVIDLAVGVIIGAAFGKIVESLVKNVLMPVVNLAVPGHTSYSSWSFGIGGAQVAYGAFLADLDSRPRRICRSASQ